MDLTWIVDPATGDLVVEGLKLEDSSAITGDLLSPAQEINCARPRTSPPLPESASVDGLVLRVARLYHGSVVDGPGRRSVVQVQGCPIGCRGCALENTHDAAGGTLLSVTDVVGALLDPTGEPRDGATVTGGEPFAQPDGLAALLRQLKGHRIHTVVYTGYTLEVLTRRPEPTVHEALQLTDLLVDGPFVAALTDGAGEWRGSRNQRLIPQPGTLLCGTRRLPGTSYRPDDASRLPDHDDG